MREDTLESAIESAKAMGMFEQLLFELIANGKVLSYSENDLTFIADMLQEKLEAKFKEERATVDAIVNWFAGKVRRELMKDGARKYIALCRQLDLKKTAAAALYGQNAQTELALAPKAPLVVTTDAIVPSQEEAPEPNDSSEQFDSAEEARAEAAQDAQGREIL